jgi:uncharacterized membrane protein
MVSKDADKMSDVLSLVLRYGVLASATIIAAGAFLFALHSPYQDASFLTRYYPGRVPHGSYDTSLWSIATGLPSLSPYSVVELGFLVLLATPVLRVAFSVVLFATEGDRRYVYITAAVLLILLFSLFVTPFIPAFGGS